MNSFFFGDAELFSPPLIGQFIKDSFSDETIFQEHETFFGAFFTSKMISVPPLTVDEARDIMSPKFENIELRKTLIISIVFPNRENNELQPIIIGHSVSELPKAFNTSIPLYQSCGGSARQ